MKQMETPFFASYTLEELQRLDYWDYTGSLPNNLTYPIHPIFERSRWENCSDDVYYGITHIIRLASAMLESPASVAFHYALMSDPREYLQETSQRLGVPCYRFRHTNHDEATTRLYFDMMMLRIAPHIRFRWFMKSDLGFAHLNAFGVTRRNLHSPTFLRGAQQSGNGSVIHINHEYIDNLSNGPKPLSQLLRYQFYMALTISHEIAHAVNNAVSVETYEPFYEDQRLTELGKAWEVEVLGGMPEMIGETDARNPLASAKWPTYADKAAPQHGTLETRGPKRYTTWYFISMKWITDIQQQSFWDVAGDTTKLRIPKKVGFQKKYRNDDYDRDWNKEDSSEGRWPGDRQGRVTREEIDENWEDEVVAPKDFFDFDVEWEDLTM